MGTETTNETSGMLKTVIQGGVIGVLVLVLILNFFERREMRAQAQNMIVAFEEMTDVMNRSIVESKLSREESRLSRIVFETRIPAFGARVEAVRNGIPQ
ncbi:hypothetical protein CMI37_10445 [Candidatus Pacearchaeota archaeon]|jgi:hypothetical protein|nr:hypothetical protein [Candidatus Pacearchaeota archaeon]|tara:strand:- start:1535 stop:1831 length:297 start_codon:yes stop_codon:yes gene_type:complete